MVLLKRKRYVCSLARIETLFVCQLTTYALDLLFIYFGWSLQSLISAESPSEDQIALRVELRDAFLQRLQDLAFGTSSSATEHCRRAAFVKLLQMYVLLAQLGHALDEEQFNALQTLQLECSDELQYRCAGFIEAEIQQYASESGLNQFENPPEENDDDDDALSQQDLQSEAEPNELQRTQGANPLLKPFERLEIDYTFNESISTFVKALVLDVIHLRHACHIMAHLGRFTNLFDECVKYLVDHVRDEGLYNDSKVAVQVLQDTFDKVSRLSPCLCKLNSSQAIDLIASGYANESYLANLIRTLTSCIVVRGQQASVSKKLPSQDIANLVSHVVEEIIRKFASLGSGASSKASKKRVLKTFKTFEKLSVSLDAASSLSVQKHLEQVMQDKEIKVGSSDKAWDAYRAFVKKLSVKAAKDPGKSSLV